MFCFNIFPSTWKEKFGKGEKKNVELECKKDCVDGVWKFFIPDQTII